MLWGGCKILFVFFMKKQEKYRIEYDAWNGNVHGLCTQPDGQKWCEGGWKDQYLRDIFIFQVLPLTLQLISSTILGSIIAKTNMEDQHLRDMFFFPSITFNSPTDLFDHTQLYNYKNQLISQAYNWCLTIMVYLSSYPLGWELESKASHISYSTTKKYTKPMVLKKIEVSYKITNDNVQKNWCKYIFMYVCKYRWMYYL